MKYSIIRYVKRIRAGVNFCSGAPAVPENGKKNILVLIPSLKRAGAERVASILASSLTQYYNVTLAFQTKDEAAYPVDPAVDLFCLPPVQPPFKDLQSSLYLRILKKKRNIVCSVSLLHTMNVRNVLSKGREFVITSERNNPKIRFPERFEATKRVYALSDHVVFQSKSVQSLYSKSVIAHSSVLPNPVSVTCEASEHPARRIVNAARLEPHKNQAMLIRAFARFYAAHPDYTLSFYGEGSAMDDLKQLCGQLRISQAVIFHGSVANIHEQIRDAEMFVLSSNVEGLSNALLEAMMMGLPCISTKCNGSVDVIEPGKNGLLTDIGDENQMYDAITLLADDPQLRKRLAAEAKNTAQAFRKETVIRQWADLIEKGIQ